MKREGNVQPAQPTIPDRLWIAVAQKRAEYYVPRWKRYASGARTFPSWHWPSLFVPFYWALYRKAWAGAVGFLILPCAVFWLIVVCMALTGSAATDAQRAVAALAAIPVSSILAAMLANGFYYRKACKLIERASEHSPEESAQEGYLSASGGVAPSWAIVVLAGLNAISFLAAILVPAYEAYAIRARVSEAVVATSECRREVVEVYESEVTTVLVGRSKWNCLFRAAGPFVQTTEIDRDGTITVKLQDVPDLGGAAGRTLTLVPVDRAGGKLSVERIPIQVGAFRCVAGTIPPHYLPVYCR